jgi:methylglyoxal synthase
MTHKPKKRIAFIAHNEKKAQMVSFVMKNQKKIESLGFDIITTGSTGDRLEESGISVFKKYSSGKFGGDIEIGSRICEGKVEMVFFFVDPFSSHAHDTDIGALERICNVKNIAIAPNPRTAELLLMGFLFEQAEKD